MGNQSARELSTHRKHVIHTWHTINQHDNQLASDIISEAWLKSAEQTPTWVWALIDLPETMHSNYKENAKFLNIVNQVRDFLQLLIKVHKCDPEMIKALSFRLGSRHRHYMNEGNDNSYWAPFTQQLPVLITKAYMHIVENDNKLKRILRIRSRAERTEEEELCESWRQFMRMIVESMKRGFEGCHSEKTPMRLSITNSIISMASMRSSRSRSASYFLEPGTVAAPPPLNVSVSTPSNLQSKVIPYRNRCRSIFNASPQHRPPAPEFAALRSRRMSTPMNLRAESASPMTLSSSDLQLLKFTQYAAQCHSQTPPPPSSNKNSSQLRPSSGALSRHRKSIAVLPF